MAFIGREDIIGADEILHGAAELVLPDALATSLEALHILTDGVDAALRNWAEGKANASKVGTPVEASGYLTLTGNASYLATAMAEPLAGTSLVVERVTAITSNGPVLIGTYAADGQTGGASIYTTSANNKVAATYANSTPAYALASAGIANALGAWSVLIQDYANTGVNLYNMTTSVSASAAPTSGYTRYTAGKPLLIGSGYASAFGGSADIGIAAAWSRVLTAAERATIYGIVQRMMKTKGIVV